jgi:hypothetical protein
MILLFEANKGFVQRVNLNARIVGHPEVIHFICPAEPPGDQRLSVFRPPDWRRICGSFLAASASRPCHRQICPSPSVSHNSGAEELAGELFSDGCA